MTSSDAPSVQSVEPLTMKKCAANASRCGEYVQLAEESLDINQSEAEASISQLQKVRESI